MKQLVKQFKTQKGSMTLVTLDEEDFVADDLVDVTIRKIDTAEHVKSVKSIFPNIEEENLIIIIENMKLVKDKSKLIDIFNIPVPEQKTTEN